MALAGVTLSLIPIQLQMFVRAVFFARLNPAAVLWNDFLCSALRLTGLAILLATGSLSVFTVFLTWGIAALSGFAAGLPFCRDFLRRGHAGILSTWNQHWRYGRWMLATSGAHWCSGQAPALLASTLLTPAAAAVIKACQYFVAPLNVAFNGLDGVLAPRASQLAAARGEATVRRFLNIFMAIGASAVVLYGLLLMPAAPALLELLYKGRYAGSVAIVGVFLLDALFLALGRAPILRAKVDGDTRRIFAAYAWAAVVGLASLAALAPALGVLGVAVAAPVSSATLLAYLMLTGSADRARRQTAQAAAQVVSES
jgi:O-antigen/teichoic acid export membrane protein